MKWLVTAVLCILTIPAYAQESKKFFTEQFCEPVQLMTAKVMLKYGEMPLFSAAGIQISATNGNAYESKMMYFVNQDTGTWTLISLYDDGTGCMVATGTNFEPYTD